VSNPTPPNADPKLVSIPEAAARFGVSTRTIERMLADGQLPCWRFRRAVRLDPEEIRTLVHHEVETTESDSTGYVL